MIFLLMNNSTSSKFKTRSIVFADKNVYLQAMADRQGDRHGAIIVIHNACDCPEALPAQPVRASVWKED